MILQAHSEVLHFPAHKTPEAPQGVVCTAQASPTEHGLHISDPQSQALEFHSFGYIHQALLLRRRLFLHSSFEKIKSPIQLGLRIQQQAQ